jgi:hypothetical protein
MQLFSQQSLLSATRPPWNVLAALGAVVLVGTPIAVAVLVNRSGSGPAAEPTIPPPAAFPVPPPGAVVYSRRLGSYALALGVVPQGRSVLLQASVIDGEGSGTSGLDVVFTVGSVRKAAEPCGAGCYRATVAAAKPRAVDVSVRGDAAGRWRVSLPVAWPPPDASALVTKAERSWRSLRSLAFSEDIASDPVHRVSSTWIVQAPDRLTYRIRGGWSAIIIGGRRWDRPPGGKRWQESPQSPIRQPVPPWSAVTDAHLLGAGSLRSRPVWNVSFFDPHTRAWFTIGIDRRNLRTLDIHMTATAHFMHDSYSRFDRPVSIRPPA